MNTPLTRAEFIKLSAVGALGFIAACDTSKRQAQTPTADSTSHAAKPTTPISSNEYVQFYDASSAEYERLRGGFNQRIQKHPKIIAECTSTEGVVRAVQYAMQQELPIAIKSGGHCFEGFSSNNGGLVIDCSAMNSVEWIDATTVRVGAGCKLGNLYPELFSRGRIIPAGSCAGVGVAGLTLGGGYGLFSREFGLTCDSLVGVTLVDGNGNVHNAKGDDDIMWACKGGGNGNFGIATHFTFTTHKAPATLTAHRFKSRGLNGAKADAILATWFEQTALLPKSCFSAFVLNGSALTILVTNTHSDSPDVEGVLKKLSEVTQSNSLGKARSLEDAVEVFYGQTNPMYFKNASAGLYKNYNDISHFITDALELVTRTPGMIYQVNTLGGEIQNQEFERASSFPHRAQSYLSELQTYWNSNKQTEHFVQAFAKVQQVFSNNGIRSQYRNYPDISLSDWQHAYYKDSYSRLQFIKGTLDPHNRIRHEQSVELQQA